MKRAIVLVFLGLLSAGFNTHAEGSGYEGGSGVWSPESTAPDKPIGDQPYQEQLGEYDPNHDDDEEWDTEDQNNQTGSGQQQGPDTTQTTGQTDGTGNSSEPVEPVVQGGGTIYSGQTGDFDEPEELIDESQLTPQEKKLLTSFDQDLQEKNKNIAQLQTMLDDLSSQPGANVEKNIATVKKQIQTLEKEIQNVFQKQEAFSDTLSESDFTTKLKAQEAIQKSLILDTIKELNITLVEANPSWQSKIKSLARKAKNFIQGLFGGFDKQKQATLSTLESQSRIITSGLKRSCLDPAQCANILNNNANTITDIQALLKKDIATVTNYKAGSDATALDAAVKRIRTFRTNDELNVFCKGLDCSLQQSGIAQKAPNYSGYVQKTAPSTIGVAGQ